jgi:hypothetical protein
MRRRVSLAGERAGRAAALVLLIAVACSVPNAPAAVPGQTDEGIRGITGDVPGQPAEQAPDAEEGSAGVYLLGVVTPPVFVFGPEIPTVLVQPGTTTLVRGLSDSKGPKLQIFPLPSPEGTSAVAIRELNKGPTPWGSISTPAQRIVYRSFAGDPKLGDWLVMVTDVAVLDGTDPVPLTAYRWPRTAVEAYAQCGIPAIGHGVPWERIDACTDQFFLDAQTVLVRGRANVAGQ